MRKKPVLWIGLIVLTACVPAGTTVPSSPTPVSQSAAPAQTQSSPPSTPPAGTPPALTAIPTLTYQETLNAPAFCSDPQPVSVINSLKTSMLTSDGALLSSLVHTSRGMKVRYFRDGKEINYTVDQAKFMFETTFEADWGNEPGSGLPKKGAFHDVIVPDLVELFNQTYSLHCNELTVGGATYVPEYPYEGNFYSVFFAGSDQYGQLDWNTWVVGMDYSGNKPYIIALMHYFWEP